MLYSTKISPSIAATIAAKSVSGQVISRPVSREGPALVGTFGAGPKKSYPVISLTRVVPASPWSPSSNGIAVGDQVIVLFDQSTNRPPVATKAQVDALLVTSPATLFGSSYSGTWLSDSQLAITATSVVGGLPVVESSAISVGIRAQGNLRRMTTDSSVNNPGTVHLGVSGNFNAAPPPHVVSLSVSDPLNDDEVYSNGDVITLVFSVDTNRAGFATAASLTKADIDSLVTFSPLSSGQPTPLPGPTREPSPSQFLTPREARSSP